MSAVREPATTVAAGPQERFDNRQVVAILGASAGGLEALQGLLTALPSTDNLILVVAQHLSPTRKSLLVELLQRSTSVPVLEIHDQTSPEPGHIYIAPPGKHLELHDGVFRLVMPDGHIEPTPSIDLLLSSAATGCSHTVVGVILSGTGSDGSKGIARLKQNGGITMVQDPQSAKYDGMPQAAILTGCVDRVLPIEELAATLHDIVVYGTLPSDTPVDLPEDEQRIDQLLQKLERRTDVNFSRYRQTTLRRRIERRIAALKFLDLGKYLDYVEQHPQELDELYNEFLITVTQFFRDTEAFKTLADTIKQSLRAHSANRPFRVWVIGCATGEEAYSIAILCMEALKHHPKKSCKVFATDIDMQALAIARQGCYSTAAMQKVSPKLRKAYFNVTDQNAEVKRPLRDMVVFSQHDIATNAPFLNIDLVSCRNVMIYFDPDLQRHVFNCIHRALVFKGLLFLGRSEQAPDSIGFVQHDRLAGLFRREGVDRPLNFIPTAAILRPPQRNRVSSRSNDRSKTEYLALLTRILVPPCVLIAIDGTVESLHGEVNQYLALGPGPASLQVLDLVHDSLRPELGVLMHQARHHKERAVGRVHDVMLGSEPISVRMTVHPLGNDDSRLLLVFDPQPASTQDDDSSHTVDDSEINRSNELERELELVRDQFRVTVDDLATANEELQSLNEELQAANEELQVSNEELQSTAEELVTVNDELQARSAELSHQSLELEAIQRTIGFAIFLIESNHTVSYINSAARSLLELTDSITLSARQLGLLLELPSLYDDVLASMADLCVREDMVSYHGRYYSIRLVPWQISVHSKARLAVGLVDQTDYMAIKRRLEESEARLLNFLHNATALIFIKDKDGRYEFANKRFTEYFDLDLPKILGRTDIQILPAQVVALFERWHQETAAQGKLIETQEILPLTDEVRWWDVARFPILDESGRVKSVCLSATDITDVMATQRTAADRLVLMRAIIDASRKHIAVLDRNGVIVATNRAWESFCKLNDGDLEQASVGTNYLEICRASQGQDDAAKAIECIKAVLDGKQEFAEFEYACHSPTNRRWFWMMVTPLPLSEGGAVISHTDITQQRQMTQRLQLVGAFFDNTGEACMIIDSRLHIVEVNKAFYTISGYAPEYMIGKHWRHLQLTLVSPLTPWEFRKELRRNGNWAGEAELLTVKGEARTLWVVLNTVSRLNDSDHHCHYVVSLTNIGHYKQVESSLMQLAYKDELTGLPNRSFFIEHLDKALARAARKRKQCALLFMDIDHFKSVNDNLGHDVGDQLLKEFTNRLLECLRRSDVAARLGGDEFVVLLEELRTPEDAAVSCEKILAAFSHPIKIGGQAIHATPSIGVAFYPDDASEPYKLLKYGDAAMYRAKESGTNCFMFYSGKAATKSKSKRRLELELDLKSEHYFEHLSMRFDVQSTVDGEAVHGIETYILWQHPKLGNVTHSELLAAAETCGDIKELTRWSVREACRLFKTLATDNIGFGRLAMDISARALCASDFLPMLEKVLIEVDFPPDWMELEISESAIIAGIVPLQVLHKAHDMGFCIAIDDFGGRNSSLNSLADYPFDSVKLQAALMRSANSNLRAQRLLRGIVAFAKELDLSVIAQGVEKAGHKRLLKTLGCTAMQNGATNQMLTAEELVQRLRGNPTVRSVSN